MHADAAVTGISRTPATAARNTIQPLADVTNLTLKSKSGQTATHIEGRSFANVLQWSISAAGAALLGSLSVLGNITTSTIIVAGLATVGGDIAFGFDNVIRRDIVNGIMEITGGSAAANGANLKLWGPSGSNGPDFALRHGSANVIFWDNSANMLYLEPAVTATNLAGVGTRFVTVDATGLLGSTTISGGGGVLGTGVANRVAYWSATDTITSSGNLTFNGTTLALTGDQTVSSTLGVTGAFTGTSGAFSTTLSVTGALTGSSASFSTTLGVTSTVTLTDLAGSGTRLVQASSTGVLSTTTAAAFGLASGTGTNTQVALWSGTATLNGSANLTFNGTTLVLTGAQTVSSTLGVTSTVTLTTLAGTGNRLVQASSTGVLSATLTVPASIVAGTGTANRVAYWSATDTITSSGNLTFNGSTLALTGAATVSSTLDVTSTVTLTTLAGSGNRLVQASSTGVLSATLTVPGSFVDGTGSANRVAYWSSTTVITSSGNLTFNGSTLALTGAQTISSTLDVTGALTVTSTSRLDGNVGIGGASNTAISLLLRSTALAGTGQYGMQSQAVFSSAATASGTSIYASVITAAASFTMTTGYGVRIDAATKGSGSTITTLYGLYIDNQTAGGTNYAIKTGTGLVQFGDIVTIGTNPQLSQALRIAGLLTSGSTQYGVVSAHMASSAATTAAICVYTQLTTQNASFTTTSGIGIQIDTPSKGASNTITNLYGLKIEDQSGGTTNYAIRTGTGRVQFGEGVLIQDTAFYTSGMALGVKRDDGVSNGEHFIAEFYRTNGGTAQLLIGYRADGASVTGQLIRSGNSLPIYFGTSSSAQAVTIANSGAVTMASTLVVTGAITATGGVVFNGGGTNLNYYLTGSFTGTFTGGGGTPPTTTCTYVRIGNIVVLTITSVTGFTSLFSTFTMTGLPAAITPGSDQTVSIPQYSFLNNSALYPGVSAKIKTTNVVEFIADGNASGWSTSGGTKGISFSVNVVYSIV